MEDDSSNYSSIVDGFHVFHFTQLNSDIPDSSITAIAVDRLHVVWIGVKDKGLVSYNGKEWTTYSTSNSQLPDNSINSICIDKMNRVWVGTYKGLASISNGTWQVYNSGNAPFVNDSIVVVRCDSVNNIWVGNSNMQYCETVRSVILKFDGTSWEVYDDSLLKLPLNKISDMEIDPLSRVWIASSRSGNCIAGLFVFNGVNTDTLQLDSSFPCEFYYFKEISYDPDGNMWVNSFQALQFTIYTAQFNHIYNSLTLEDDSTNNALKQFQLTNPYYPHFAFTKSFKWASSARIIDSYYRFPSISYFDGTAWNRLLEADQHNFNAYDVTCMASSWPDTVWIGTQEGLLKIY